jgi:hypothetical protein
MLIEIDKTKAAVVLTAGAPWEAQAIFRQLLLHP